MRQSGIAKVGVGLAAVGVLLAGWGCTIEEKHEREDRGVPFIGDPVDVITGPAYVEVAPRYNENVAPLQTLFAGTIVRMRWFDRDGKEHNEQGEGRLQVLQPDRVAMSVGKVGEVFFWLGCDAKRYWWFDLSGKPRLLFFGNHDTFAQSNARSVGVVVPPLDMLRLIGIVPLPADGGRTQWSKDHRTIGVTTILDSGGRQRMWLDAQTWLPTKIELYNAAGELDLVSDLSVPDRVDVRGMPARPAMNTRIIIGHHPSRSQITIDLADMQDGKDRIVPEAFDLKQLYQRLRGEKAYDLDAPLPGKRP